MPARGWRIRHPDKMAEGRMAAITVFVVAAVSDFWMDGWLAALSRSSRLGVVLDPIADKALTLFSAIITLCLTDWTYRLPIWFAVLVIARDAGHYARLCRREASCRAHGGSNPSWTGQNRDCPRSMIAPSAWRDARNSLSPVCGSMPQGFSATLLSGMGYILDGMRQMHEHGQAVGSLILLWHENSNRIAIVGRPNVGKSAIFNQFARSKNCDRARPGWCDAGSYCGAVCFGKERRRLISLIPEESGKLARSGFRGGNTRMRHRRRFAMRRSFFL